MKSVLIVDDEADIAEILNALLANEGFRVRTAGDGREALALIADERPDVILLDVMMPVMDGREMCRALKSAEATASIPIVIMSAGSAISREECAYDALLRKPFDFDALVATIARLTYL